MVEESKEITGEMGYSPLLTMHLGAMSSGNDDPDVVIKALGELQDIVEGIEDVTTDNTYGGDSTESWARLENIRETIMESKEWFEKWRDDHPKGEKDDTDKDV